MAKWQRTIKLNPEWQQAQDNEIAPAQLAKAIAAKLTAIAPLEDTEVDDERLELIDQFEDIANEPDATEHDIDRVMENLYDWGDISLDSEWNGKKVCFIDAFSRVEAEGERP